MGKHVYVLYLYEFTLLSNGFHHYVTKDGVLYLYEFTLLSNRSTVFIKSATVLYLYEFTLLSNMFVVQSDVQKFYTSMNLHCSQTPHHIHHPALWFYTSMNLHCSQTSNFENPACNWYVNPHLCYTFLYNKYQHISFLIP